MLFSNFYRDKKDRVRKQIEKRKNIHLQISIHPYIHTYLSIYQYMHTCDRYIHYYIFMEKSLIRDRKSGINQSIYMKNPIVIIGI